MWWRSFRPRLTHFLTSSIALIGVLAAAATLAQPPQVARIGVLWPGDVPRYDAAFLDGLRRNGFVDGTNAVVHIRSTGADFESGPALAKELIALDPHVIYVSPGLLAKHLLQELEKSRKDIPVVVHTWDPVAEELVSNVARPGKSITGIGYRPAVDLVTKHLQLIKDLIPRVNRVVHFLDPSWFLRSYTQESRMTLENAGRRIGVMIFSVEVANPEGLEEAFSEAVRRRPQGIIIPGGPTFWGNRDRVTGLAAKHRLPAVYDDELMAYAGGLMSYGASFTDQQHLAAAMVAKILRGAKPADMPVEYATRFRLVVNLRTAAGLALDIPQSVFVQADEVIR